MAAKLVERKMFNDLKELFRLTEQLFHNQSVQDNVDSIEFYSKTILHYDKSDPDFNEFLEDFMQDIMKFALKNIASIRYREQEFSGIVINCMNIFWPIVSSVSQES